MQVRWHFVTDSRITLLDTIVSLPMRLKQRVALSVLAALLLFAATAVWLQFTRDDLDWQRATLSLYLHGPHGLLLRVAYCVLASAIVVLGPTSPRLQ